MKNSTKKFSHAFFTKRFEVKLDKVDSNKAPYSHKNFVKHESVYYYSLQHCVAYPNGLRWWQNQFQVIKVASIEFSVWYRKFLPCFQNRRTYWPSKSNLTRLQTRNENSLKRSKARNFCNRKWLNILVKNYISTCFRQPR